MRRPRASVPHRRLGPGPAAGPSGPTHKEVGESTQADPGCDHWLARAFRPGQSSSLRKLGDGFLTPTLGWEQRALGCGPGSQGWEGLGRSTMP